MYLLSAKPVSPGRRKRSSTNNEGNKFLRGLRQRVGSATFDSFMAVQGDVSLMFVIDDTGSMSDEIQAAKNIAIDIINYPREAPIVTYILSPFNDPYPGKLLRNFFSLCTAAPCSKKKSEKDPLLRFLWRGGGCYTQANLFCLELCNASQGYIQEFSHGLWFCKTSGTGRSERGGE